MTIQIKHSFVSAKGDGGDATLVRPSNWNAAHATSMATGQLVGRLTAGVGSFEEIPISTYMAGLLAANDAATLAGLLGLFETGDVKYTFKTTASPGWIMMQGGLGVGPGQGNTIGSATSGALIRANADTLALYTLLYNAVNDTLAPVSGGRSGNPATDFAANKTLSIPYLVGRSPIGAGIATSSLALYAHPLGQGMGEELHALTQSEMPNHYHVAGIYDPGHTHTYTTLNGGLRNDGTSALTVHTNYNTLTTNPAVTGVRVTSPNGLDTTYSTGGDAPHNNLHPVIGLNVMVKL